jgi:hypothetical protein
LGEEKNILAKEKETEKIHHEEHEGHEGGGRFTVEKGRASLPACLAGGKSLLHP